MLKIGLGKPIKIRDTLVSFHLNTITNNIYVSTLDLSLIINGDWGLHLMSTSVCPVANTMNESGPLSGTRWWRRCRGIVRCDSFGSALRGRASGAVVFLERARDDLPRVHLITDHVRVRLRLYTTGLQLVAVERIIHVIHNCPTITIALIE